MRSIRASCSPARGLPKLPKRQWRLHAPRHRRRLEMTSQLLQISHLGVEFRQPSNTVVAVRDVSLDVGEGETVALVGESGSGKSVTALSVLQLLPYPVAVHTPGSSIRYRQRELVGADERALREVRGDRVSMIFQEPMTSLNP